MYKMSDFPPYARQVLVHLIEFSDDGQIWIHPKFIKWLTVARFKFDDPDIALRCVANCKIAPIRISQFDVCSSSMESSCDVRFLMYGFVDLLTLTYYITEYLEACGVSKSAYTIEAGIGRFPSPFPLYMLFHFESGYYLLE